ncbi:hypothetical protein N7454_002769 [Penicillium verhagenii]|nr:hypothetical protein N7454_002769 [Penicillium verhagenii]
MSTYTGAPNNYGQARNQAYYPPHQGLNNTPQQEFHNSSEPQPYTQPRYDAGASPGAFPSQYNQQQPQGYHPNGPGHENAPQDRGYAPYPPAQQQAGGENSSYYGSAPHGQASYATGPGPAGPQGEGERGLGSTLIGGAAGGFAGHKMQGGFLGTAGGAVLGAVGMNMATHEM